MNAKSSVAVIGKSSSPKQGGFAMHPANMDEAMEMATMLSSSSMVPSSYKQKPADTLVAMMMGHELGLNPIASLQNIAVINGRPSIYGDALVALVQSHPAYGGMEETFDKQSMTATCVVWRKGSDVRHTQTFSQANAVLANLWGKVGPWKQYPNRMLQMRARGFALRDCFADALAGLITAEEAQDMPVEAIDVTPAQEAIESPASISESQQKELETAMKFADVDSDYLCKKADIPTLDQLHPDRFEGCLAHLRCVAGRKNSQGAAQ
jgi:hypothetical protein